ncbi:hypothetical protein HPULCUR_007472 [Helicostylum pulchrum]|uniref:Uncharacterized protein n=1 Tax=Helicostylum pulchrum TaxID=562976 RepID=A0ABP9Y6Q4_9FUNG
MSSNNATSLRISCYTPISERCIVPLTNWEKAVADYIPLYSVRFVKGTRTAEEQERRLNASEGPKQNNDSEESRKLLKKTECIASLVVTCYKSDPNNVILHHTGNHNHQIDGIEDLKFLPLSQVAKHQANLKIDVEQSLGNEAQVIVHRERAFYKIQARQSIRKFNPGQLGTREALGKLLTAGETEIGQLYSDLPNEHATALREFFRLQYTRCHTVFGNNKLCDQFRLQYIRWHTVFGNNKLDVITEFLYATPQRIPALLQCYADLLKDIDSYQTAVKRCAAATMFQLLQRMKLKGSIPNFEVQESVGGGTSILKFNSETRFSDFVIFYEDPVFKEELCEQNFRLDKIKKNKKKGLCIYFQHQYVSCQPLLIERDTENTPNGYQLAYKFRTNGRMISVHFQKDFARPAYVVSCL